MALAVQVPSVEKLYGLFVKVLNALVPWLEIRCMADASHPTHPSLTIRPM